MADPLLTSLCTICRVQPPKYKCPRCGTRTCSLPCIKKHKNWSSCSGERDPTVYVPPKRLRTAAGVDHDYNFLTKIERTVEQSEKIFRDERGVIPDRQSDVRPNKSARLHKGQSRGRVTLDENSRKWGRDIIQRMQRLGVNVTSLPYGMVRSKENNTTWNKKTRGINWQVEWIVLHPDALSDSPTPKTTRILHKMLEHTQLYEGFMASWNQHEHWKMSPEQRAQEKETRRKLNSELVEGQNRQSATWTASRSACQNPKSGRWDQIFPGFEWLPSSSAKTAFGEDHQFFSLKPNTPSKESQKLIPLQAAENLTTLLPGLDILEFPTIVVLPSGAPIPDGYTVEQKPRMRSVKGPKKRDASGLVAYESSDEESGVASDHPGSDDGSVSPADTTSSSGSDDEMDED